VRRQENLEIVEKKNFSREELPRKYIVKMLYGWDNGDRDQAEKRLC